MRLIAIFLSLFFVVGAFAQGQSTPFAKAGSQSYIAPSSSSSDTSALLSTNGNGAALTGVLHASDTNGFLGSVPGNYLTTNGNGAALSGVLKPTDTNSFLTAVPGTYLTTNGAGSFSGKIYINPTMLGQTLTYSASTITPNLSLGNYGTVTLSNSAAFSNPTGMTTGGFAFVVIENATGTWTPTFGSAFHFPGRTAPTATTWCTNANATNVLNGFSVDAANYLCTWNTNF